MLQFCSSWMDLFRRLNGPALRKFDILYKKNPDITQLGVVNAPKLLVKCVVAKS